MKACGRCVGTGQLLGGYPDYDSVDCPECDGSGAVNLVVFVDATHEDIELDF